MNYVIEFGEYFYTSGGSSKILNEVTNIVISKDIKNAYWFKNKEDAIKKSEKIGGIVIQFTIVVEEIK